MKRIVSILAVLVIALFILCQNPAYATVTTFVESAMGLTFPSYLIWTSSIGMCAYVNVWSDDLINPVYSHTDENSDSDVYAYAITPNGYAEAFSAAAFLDNAGSKEFYSTTWSNGNMGSSDNGYGGGGGRGGLEEGTYGTFTVGTSRQVVITGSYVMSLSGSADALGFFDGITQAGFRIYHYGGGGPQYDLTYTFYYEILPGDSPLFYSGPISESFNAVAGTTYYIDNVYASASTFTMNTPSPIPEPNALLLLGTGLIGIVSYAKYKFNRKKN